MPQLVDNYLPPPGVQDRSQIGSLDPFQDNFDPGLRRPWIPERGRYAGRACVTVNTGRYTTEKGEKVPITERRPVMELVLQGRMLPVFNATALRKEEWAELDRVVVREARLRLTAWADLLAANSYGGFNAMSKIMLEHETMNDAGEAVVSMNGITPGRTDAPLFQLEGIPLPITHSDFYTDSRRLAISRNTGTPFDTTMGEMAGRRVAEMIEKTTIGVETGITYGGTGALTGGGAYSRSARVFGYLNFSPRLLKTNFTAPTAGSWTPELTMQEFNAALNQIRLNKFYGPFMVYNSSDLDPYLDGDYYVAKSSGAVAPTKTLRDRLLAIRGIQDVKRLDFMPASASTYAYSNGDPADITSANPFTYIFVQMTSEVAQAINGMDITTLQWETLGGMQINYKVMCIQVPRLRATYKGNCGILQGTTS